MANNRRYRSKALELVVASVMRVYERQVREGVKVRDKERFCFTPLSSGLLAPHALFVRSCMRLSRRHSTEMRGVEATLARWMDVAAAIHGCSSSTITAELVCQAVLLPLQAMLYVSDRTMDQYDKLLAFTDWAEAGFDCEDGALMTLEILMCITRPLRRGEECSERMKAVRACLSVYRFGFAIVELVSGGAHADVLGRSTAAGVKGLVLDGTNWFACTATELAWSKLDPAAPDFERNALLRETVRPWRDAATVNKKTKIGRVYTVIDLPSMEQHFYRENKAAGAALRNVVDFSATPPECDVLKHGTAYESDQELVKECFQLSRWPSAAGLSALPAFDGGNTLALRSRDEAIVRGALEKELPSKTVRVVTVGLCSTPVVNLTLACISNK